MRNRLDFAPNLSSWINAFLLAGILIAATSLIPTIHNLWSIIVLILGWGIYLLLFIFSFIIRILPEFIQFIITGIVSFISSLVSYLVALISPFIALASTFILLLPIPIIAFAHHYLYLLLDRYYPDLADQRSRITGYLPGIVSWWHGLYSLLVIILALLFSDAILSIIPGLNFDYMSVDFQHSDIAISGSNSINIWIRIALIIFGQPIYQPFLRLVIWVVAAAYLYQFEFSFKQHLITTASDSRSDR